MTTRTRATKGTQAKPAPGTTAPAKKATAKKTPARPASRRQAPAAPARERVKVSLRKPAARPKISLAKKPTLPTQPWMTDTQGWATLAARIAGLDTPHITDWIDHGDNTASRHFADGTALTYQHDTHALAWTAPCPQGEHHAYALAAPGDLQAAVTRHDQCTERHAPTGPAVRNLADAFTHDTERTQPMPKAEIAAGLEARTAAPDNDQAKEHPSE
ncbi:hypothetical protein [Streptomyces sp. NPDC056982]|uniref:hypothetical protein n=1 Tax=Streptomyces sp. NPDC056982 TaxID=3345986 RepID=UPI0036419751